MILGFFGFLITSIIRNKKQEGQPLVCPIGSSCDAVIHSSYSSFFGIDLTLFGKMYYGSIVIVYAFLLALPQFAPTFLHPIGLGLSVFAVIFSAYLIIVQFVVLRDWCLWCIGSALVSTAILISSAIGIDGLPLFLYQHESILSGVLVLATALGLGSVLVSDSFFIYFLQDGRISYSESKVLNFLAQITWFAISIIILVLAGVIVSSGVAFASIGIYLPEIVLLIFILGVIIINNILLNLMVNPKIVDITFSTDGPDVYSDLRKFSFAFSFVSIVSWIFFAVVLFFQERIFAILPWLAGYVICIVLATAVSQYIEYRKFQIK